MSEEYAAYISIGGKLPRSQVGELLEAIRNASVSHEWGDAPFAPRSAEELSEALHDGRLWLCDDHRRYGTFPDLEAACRKLGLSYARWSEGCGEFDADLVEFRPGMRKPLARHSSNASEATFVPTQAVRRALKHLEAGQVAKARALLRSLCPNIRKVPAFKIV